MGVYEVWYAANTLAPDHRVSGRLAAAERVVFRLVEDGLVDLWRGRWVSVDEARTPVPASELDQVLRSWSTWCPDGDSTVVWMERRAGDANSS